MGPLAEAEEEEEERDAPFWAGGLVSPEDDADELFLLLFLLNSFDKEALRLLMCASDCG